jgi:radical SAM-linked protein
MMKFIPIRVFFTKTGDAKYISHLDLYRSFGRSIKRSGLSVWVTEGFNPHIYLTFALPLALGVEGVHESVDIRLLSEKVTEDDLRTAAHSLNAVMPQGLSVTRAAEPVCKANDIEKAQYEVHSPNAAALNDFFSQEQIVIEKKSKSKTQTLDVKPLLSWDESGGVLTLPAGNTLNINPWNVLGGLPVSNVKRTAILCSSGELFA